MEDKYIFLALIMHLVITIVIVVDWRMNLLNEVEVLTTRLSKDIFRPTHYKTNLKQGAHILYTPTHCLGDMAVRMREVLARPWVGVYSVCAPCFKFVL